MERGIGWIWGILPGEREGCRRESLCGVADPGGGSYFYEPGRMFQLQGDHTTQPPWESLLQDVGEEAPTDCLTSDSGEAVWFWEFAG